MKALLFSGAAGLLSDDRDPTDSPTVTFLADEQKTLGIEGCTGAAFNGTVAADEGGTSSATHLWRTLYLTGTGYWTHSPYPYLAGLKSHSWTVAESLGTRRRPRNFLSESAGFRGRNFGRPPVVREFALGVARHSSLAEVEA